MQQAVDTSLPMCCHHDQVAASFLRHLADVIGGLPFPRNQGVVEINWQIAVCYVFQVNVGRQHLRIRPQ